MVMRKSSVNVSAAEPASKAVSGFSLIETLVALVIVAMSITIFFQLFSGGMRLESRARELAQNQFTAGRIFDALQRLDIRDADFPWQGEHEGKNWEIRILPVDVLEESMDDGFALRRDQELFTLEFVLDTSSGPPTRLIRYVAFPLNFLPTDILARMP
ncbi:MAG: type II secretion system protein [Desulfovibrionales bacterium]|nr:MAG: type II secretion system protein [Desulfovibrionales bacterium]